MARFFPPKAEPYAKPLTVDRGLKFAVDLTKLRRLPQRQRHNTILIIS